MISANEETNGKRFTTVHPLVLRNQIEDAMTRDFYKSLHLFSL